MATMTIRSLPADLHQRLRMRAARNGRSMEAEVRSILADTLVPPPGEEFDPRAIQDYVRGLYEGQLPSGVVDELIAERRAEAAREP